jgi:hypothetical protein
VGGATVVHVYSDVDPGDGFVAREPDLEDVYFHRLQQNTTPRTASTTKR